MSAICNVNDYAKSTKLLASTAMRTILGMCFFGLCLYFCFVCLLTISFLFTGTKSLAEILSDRESIAKDMLTSLDESTDPWGIKVCICLNGIRNGSQK